MPAPSRYFLFRFGELIAAAQRTVLTLGVQATVLLVVVLLVVGLPGKGEASGASRKPVEVASLRNANSDTVVNADGTFTTQVYAQPVNFRDAAGHWRPIEAKFAKSSRDGFEWQSGANSFHVDFKQQADSAFLRFDPGTGSPFTLALDGANPSVGAKQTENDLLFRNVVQQTDLTYALLPQGLKESLILHNANAGPNFTFTLAPTDKSAELRAVKQDDGSYAFYQGGGEPVFTLQTPIVRDSAAGKPPKGNADPSKAPKGSTPETGGTPPAQTADNTQVASVAVGKVAMDVTRQDDGSFTVKLAVAPAWLSDPERVFPVVLDPTISNQADIQDGYWNTASATSTPNISDTELYGGQDGSGADYASGLIFNLGAIPPAARVTSAMMSLSAKRCIPTSTGQYASYGCPFWWPGSGVNSSSFSLYPITSAWSSSTQWQNVSVGTTSLGDYGGQFYQSTGSQIPTTATFSGTALAGSVQAIVNGSSANNGFLLKKVAGDASGLTFASSRWPDVTLAPQLTIEWSADGVQLADPTNVHSNGAELSWQHYNGGLGPYATAVLADHPTAYYRFDDGAGSRLGVADWSGNEQNGSANGGITLGQPGATVDGDQSLAFNGAGYVRGGESAPLNAVADTFTIEAWVKRANTASGLYTIFSRGESNGGGFRLQLTSGNQLELAGGDCDGCANGNYHQISTSSATITDTSWHYVAASKSGGSVHLYIDGTESTGAVNNETLTTGWGKLIVGSNVSADYNNSGAEVFNQYWYGQIDEPAVYDHVLSSSTIAAHYAAAAQLLAGFDHYEIHRSATSNFTPSAATLVAKIKDASVQTYRDTTAKPSTTFYYKVITFTNGGANSYASNQVTVATPAAGQATVTIQPGFSGAIVKATALSAASTCANQGGQQTIPVDASDRGLLQFDLRQIPNGSIVNSAKLSLFTFSNTAATVEAHRLTSDWTEGTATSASCDGSGTSWANRNPSVAWAAAGGDFNTTTAATVSDPGGSPHWDDFTGNGMASLVQGWLDGSYANFGVLLKHATESGAPSLAYLSNDYATSSVLRPKLVVSYTDNSVSTGPSVGVGVQGVSALSGVNPPVTGTVTLTAGASDDGQVTSVQFYRDSSPAVAIGSALTAAPYQMSWDTTAVGRGGHTVFAVATDDAGNQTTAPALTVNVVNSTAPTGVAITAAAVQSGSTWSATATASDDVGVSRVDFLVDGNLVASDTSSPYTQSFDTLGASNPVYDGSHMLTARAFDGDGNATLSADYPITVANGSGQYKAGLATAHTSSVITDIPVGAVVAYAGSTLPSGWLWADGSAVSRSSYSELWSAFNTAYGSGDGSSTFTLPNLQGRFPLGKAASGTGSTLGATGGSLDMGSASPTVSLPTISSFAFSTPATTFSAGAIPAFTPSGFGFVTGPRYAYNPNNYGYSPTAISFGAGGGQSAGWATFTMPSQAATSGSVAPTATLAGGNTAYRVLRYIVKAASSAVFPACAIFPSAAGSTPSGAQTAHGQTASGNTASCLASAFSGNVPDLQGRFPLGMATSGTGSTLNGGGGSLDLTQAVNRSVPGGATVTVPNYTTNLTVPGGSYAPSGASFVGSGGGNGQDVWFIQCGWSNCLPNATTPAVNTPNASGGGGSFSTNAVTDSAQTAPVNPSYQTFDYVAYNGAAAAAAGTVTAYGGSTAPAGWLVANGTCVSQGSYPALYAATGDRYGSSCPDGQFKLPDLQGRFPLGQAASGTGSTLGASGGSLAMTPSVSLPAFTPSFSWTPSPFTFTVPARTATFSGVPSEHNYLDSTITVILLGSGSWTSSSFGATTFTATPSSGGARTVNGTPTGAATASFPAETPAYQTFNYLISVGGQVASSTYIPNEMRYDPNAGSQAAVPVVVTLTDSSTVSWPTATTKLRTRWLNSDGSVLSTFDTSIGATDMAASEVRDVAVTVPPPTLPAATLRGRFTLSFDLIDTTSNTLFSTKGVQPLNRTVEVTRDTPDELGLERYQQVDGIDTGVGTANVNLFNGNLAFTHSITNEPGVGLNTVAGLTYNSAEVGSVSPAGNGFSLGLSGLLPVGQHLDVHPNAADIAAGQPAKWIGFTDKDGSYHRFLGNASGSYYTAPAGVHLYLKVTSSDSQHYYGFYKPDRTAFFFDSNGWPTRVEDKDGNALVYTETSSPADAFGVAKQITSVTDQGGRSFTLTYNGRSDTSNPLLLGKLRKLTDHIGHAWLFSYYNDGNLLAVTEKGGTNVDGSYLPDRRIVFSYLNAAGSGPAIGTLAARQSPDPNTIQGSRLYSVLDYKGQETSFAYVTAAGATQWRLSQITDRAGKTTGYAYTPATPATTVTKPLSRVWAYTFDGQARVNSIIDPLSETTSINWTADNEVQKVTEPTGAFTEHAYNANGQLTDSWDALRDHTSIVYENLPVDSNDVSGNWESGRTIGHISRPLSTTKPQGNASYSAQVLGNGPRGYWRFGESSGGTAADASGNGVGASYGAGITLGSSGALSGDTNTAITLSGTATGFVQNTGTSPTTGQFSIETWAYLTGPGSVGATDYGTLAGFDGSHRILWSSSTGLLLAQISGASLTSTNPLSLNAWHHIVYTFDGSTARFYTDGVANGSGATTAPSWASSWKWGSYDNSNYMFKGKLDEGVIYNYALTAAQISVHDKAGLGQPTGVETTTFSYAGGVDASKDRLVGVTDALGNTSAATYNNDGTLATQTKPSNGDGITRTTTFNGYDLNGLPTQVTDAAGGVSRAGYDAAGDQLWVQDPNHGGFSGGSPAQYRSYAYYDSFGRVGRSSTPKATASLPGLLIWADTSFDANDNALSVSNAHYGGSDSNNAPVTQTAYDAMDRTTSVTGPRLDSSGLQVKATTEYDDAGRVIRVTKPNGVKTTGIARDYATETSYDALDRPYQMTNVAVDGSGNYDAANSRITSYCYDLAGDLRSVTAPKGYVSFSGCPAAVAPASYVYTTAGYTSKSEYDAAHQLIKQISADGTSTQTAYNADGATTATTDENGAVTRFYYDARGLKTRVVSPFDAANGRTLTALTEYDALGNVSRKIPPRAYDAANGSGTYNVAVTSYSYDALGRTSKVTQAGTADLPQSTYVHMAYDANGNVTRTSLPSSQSNPANLAATETTTVSYFDTGAIAAQTDPGTPTVHFDYTPEGWQSMRVPEQVTAPGTNDLSKAMYWNYYSDGLLKSLSDLGGERAYYSYDADGNQTAATEATGITQVAQSPLTVQRSFDGFDQLTKTRLPKTGTSSWLATLYSYDLHGLPTSLTDNREEDASGNQTLDGRTITYTYNNLDQVVTQTDNFGTPAISSDDEQVSYSYRPTGALASRTLSKANGGGWTQEQQAVNTYFDNGQLKQLSNYDATTLIEQHTLSYLDSNGVYLNGNKASDVFTQKQADGSNTCWTASCTTSWNYNGQDQVVQETSTAGSGTNSSFVLDAEGNVTSDTTNGTLTSKTYTGQKLVTVSSGGTTNRNIYDSAGNLDCVTGGSWTAATCPAPGDPNLLTDYIYDYKNRLANVRVYNGSGALTDSTDYVNDPLDRVASESETHGIGGSPTSTNTTFQYLGDSNAVSKETLTGSGATVKTYLFDAFGQRLTFSDSTAGTRLSYLYDPHGNVSGLLDQSSGLKQNYGYNAYGGTNNATSKNLLNFDSKANPYTYSAERWDSGSKTFDMGARRYNSGTGRWLQQDIYYSALDNLGLASDPLGGNRYLFTGANPVNYVEVDGHHAIFGDDETCTPGASGCLAPAAGPPSSPPQDPVTDQTGSTSDPNPSAGTRDLQGIAGCGFANGCYNLSAQQFINATWSQRAQWLRAANTRWGLDGWLNNISGIVDYFTDSKVFGADPRMMAADGYVLWAVAQGLEATFGNGSLNNWGRFFSALRSHSATDETLRNLWGKAEQGGVDFATAMTDSIPESGTQLGLYSIFVFVGNQYRYHVTHSTSLGIAGVGIKHPDPRRDRAAVYELAMTVESAYLALGG